MATEDLLAKTRVLEAELLARDAELNELRKLRVKKYEQVPQLDTTYLRSARGSLMIHKRPSHNSAIVEDVCKVVLKRYHIGSTMGGTEHYMFWRAAKTMLKIPTRCMIRFGGTPKHLTSSTRRTCSTTRALSPHSTFQLSCQTQR